MPAQDLENFRQSMRRLAATVCIISCQRDGVRYGITVTSVTSLCMEPQSILSCINQSASIRPHIRDVGRYCVNLLTQRQADISKRFSGGVPASERFLEGNWCVSDDGIPYLADAQANIFCEIDEAFAYATHDILVGRVISSRFNTEIAPLLYQDGKYAVGAPLDLSAAA
jgi:flavin reductase (DIM6/NTAB) family NADH-FMN oxidoreductase RutF